MVGILCALSIELEALRNELENPVTEILSGISYTKGFLRGRECVLSLCGVGKVNAAVGAQTMALVYRPQMIINSGVAGALTKDLHPGDIAVGRDVVQHDVDTTALGDPPGFVSTVNVTYFPCDPHISREILKAAQALKTVHAISARIASGEQFVSSSAKKSEIVRRFSAAACEMEAGAIAQVCYMNKIPVAIIRAISDSADETGHIDYAQFLPLAAENSARLVMNFLETV